MFAQEFAQRSPLLAGAFRGARDVAFRLVHQGGHPLGHHPRSGVAPARVFTPPTDFYIIEFTIKFKLVCFGKNDFARPTVTT